jgi:bifunctional DNA-binding transcriptional regulator/antitoxin component of YhaV-PrlF toxin-antitoxin module
MEKCSELMEQETFIAEVQDLNRTTIPKEIVELLKIKKGQKIKLAVIRVYR